MGRHGMAAVRVLARCSPSTPVARGLRTCIVSLAAATELIRWPDWFHREAPCMGRPMKAETRTLARYSQSTPAARVLRPCIVLHHSITIAPLALIPTATEPGPKLA